MVNINNPKLTVLQSEILRLLFIKAGVALNQHRIATILEVTPPAVMKALPALETEGLITLQQDAESKRWAIQLRRDDHRALQLKRADNLRQVYETGLADRLEQEFAGATIILFGSYARGEDTINSDLDIAIIGRKAKMIDLSRYEKMLEREININAYASFATIHKRLKENLCNGIVLFGGIEL